MARQGGLQSQTIRQKMQDKGLSELDNFLIRNNQQPTPRRSYISTQQAKNNLVPPKQHHTKENQPLINNTSRSPARSASKRTLSSHDSEQPSLNLSRQRARSRRSIKVMKRHCENHEDTEGSYRINIEGEDLFYCQKCAIKLRNQGFPVKMESNTSSKNRSKIFSSQCSSVLESYSHLEGHPQFQTLRVLLNNIYQSEFNLKKGNRINVEEVYQQTADNFEAFMDKIEEIVNFHRLQGRKTLSRIFADHQSQPGFGVEESIKEIQIMKNDIEGNIELIVQQVQGPTFQQCVQSYRDRIEQINSLSTLNNQSLEQLKDSMETTQNNTLQTLKNDLEKALTEIKGPNIKEEDQSLLCNQGFPNEARQVDNRGAFRNLFEPNRVGSRKRGISKK